MKKNETWIVPVIPRTLIPWTYDTGFMDDPERIEYISHEFAKFDATIKFCGFRKGYSSGIKVIFEDLNRTYTTGRGEIKNITYGIFITDAEEIITKLTQGTMTGKFEACKRGSSYGIRLVI